MTRIRRSLEYALGMPSPNSIYGPILTQSTTSGNPKTAKCRIYPTGNRSSYDPYDDSSDYNRRPRHPSDSDDEEGAAIEHAEWLRRRALGVPI
jgi:hypothetical protein